MMIMVLSICLAVSASACSRRENTGEPVIPQSQSLSQSQSAAEPSIPKEAIPHQPGEAQLAEMELAVNAVIAFDWPEDAWEHFDALESLAEEVAALSVTVHYKDNWKDYNSEKVRAFVEAVQSGQDAFVTVVRIGYTSSACSPYAYYTEGQDVYTCFMSLQDDTITLSTPELIDKDKISITDYGHFFGTMPSSFRVVNLPQENLDAYWKYVDPIGGYLTFRDSWQTVDFSKKLSPVHI